MCALWIRGNAGREQATPLCKVACVWQCDWMKYIIHRIHTRGHKTMRIGNTNVAKLHHDNLQFKCLFACLWFFPVCFRTITVSYTNRTGRVTERSVLCPSFFFYGPAIREPSVYECGKCSLYRTYWKLNRNMISITCICTDMFLKSN
jgi:hypothetical protein